MYTFHFHFITCVTVSIFIIYFSTNRFFAENHKRSCALHYHFRNPIHMPYLIRRNCTAEFAGLHLPSELLSSDDSSFFLHSHIERHVSLAHLHTTRKFFLEPRVWASQKPVLAECTRWPHCPSGRSGYNASSGSALSGCSGRWVVGRGDGSHVMRSYDWGFGLRACFGGGGGAD